MFWESPEGTVATIPAGCDRRVLEMMRSIAFDDVDDFADLGEPDDDTQALIDVLGRLGDESAVRFNPAEPRDGHGRWSKIADRIEKALKDWSNGDGHDDPLKDFNREQVRQVAKARGIELKRGESEDSIKAKILDHVRAQVAQARGAKPPTAPGATAGHQRFSITHNGKRIDVGIFGNKSGLAVHRESDSGRMGAAVSPTFANMSDLHAWADGNGHTQLAEYARKEAGLPAAKAPVKAATKAAKAATPAVKAPGREKVGAVGSDLGKHIATQYAGHNKTVAQIAEENKLSESTVRRILAEHGVAMRRPGGSAPRPVEAAGKAPSRAELMAQVRSAPSKQAARELLQGLPASEVKGILGDFGLVPESGRNTKAGHIETIAKHITGGRIAHEVGKAGMPSAEDRVRAAYAAAATRPGAWVPLTAIREQMTREGFSRKQVDEALTSLGTKPGAQVIPWDNYKALTAADHAAALRIGGQDAHVIRIEPAAAKAPNVKGVAESLAEVHELTHNGASDRALLHRINARQKLAGTSDEFAGRLRSAVDPVAAEAAKPGAYVPRHVQNVLDHLNGKPGVYLPDSVLFATVNKHSYEAYFTDAQRKTVLDRMRSVAAKPMKDAAERKGVERTIADLESIPPRNERISQTLAALESEHGLSRIGNPGDRTGFNGALHESSQNIEPGAPVEITRPGYHATVNGEKRLAVKAHVVPAKAERPEVAAAKAHHRAVFTTQVTGEIGRPSMSREHVAEVNRQMDRQSELAPHTVQRLNGISVDSNFSGESKMGLYMPAENYGSPLNRNLLGQRIYLNRRFAQTTSRPEKYQELADKFEEYRSEGWTAKSELSPLEYTVSHEFGHHVMRQLAVITTDYSGHKDEELSAPLGRPVLAAMDKHLGTTFLDELDKNTYAVYGGKKVVSGVYLNRVAREHGEHLSMTVSKYAGSGQFHELMAEVWQMYSTQGDAAPPGIRAVGDVMRSQAEKAARVK